ncbi:hypothetical protein NYQ25_12720 [Curtobacterium flaccumfaciens pv. flaccumfaciens]|uniref:hypothetical protein n=1 Tax=Curtobacterium flaccumfaciens TaxID=2035 RepID=UPI00217E01D5|nr:hypothetical protein [Curtobacterium flaccumfaciens]MCS6585840.1 hypothetical protein [Curtobacterium flaccumfaciens pv. flaccumfaciens]
MTMTIVDNSRLAELQRGRGRHALVRQAVRDALGGTLALITLDNGKGYKRPNTLGPRTP